MTLKGAISGRQRLHTYTEGAFMPAGAKDCLTGREICRGIPTTADDLFGWWGIIHTSGEHSRPMVHPLMSSEDSLKIISDSQRLIHTEASEARREGYLARLAEGPLRSSEGRLRPTEDLRQADGALKSAEKHCQNIALSMSFRM